MTTSDDKVITGEGQYLGLGCPLQDNFAFDHKNRIKAAQICVGAAFDFYSGNTKMGLCIYDGCRGMVLSVFSD